MRPGLVLGREVLDWHRKTGEELTDRIMAMSINASMENWPHRVKSMKGSWAKGRGKSNAMPFGYGLQHHDNMIYCEPFA